MAFPRILSRQSQLQAEADGGNLLNGTYANQPPTMLGAAGAPARVLELRDAANPQLRLTNAGGFYADLQVSATGMLNIAPSGDATGKRVGINQPAPNAILQVVGVQPAAVSTTPGTTAANTFQVTGALAGGRSGGDTTIATTGVGGVGGAVVVSGGIGGQATAAVTSATGGVGGGCTLGGGTGGAGPFAGAATNTGGNGGACTINSGGGGAVSVASGTNKGGDGGLLTVQAGGGGAASTGTVSNTGGAGGGLSLVAGTGGNGASQNGNGGNLTLSGGPAGAGGGAAGTRGYVAIQANGGWVSVGAGAPLVHLHQSETVTLTGAVTDGFAANHRHSPGYTGAFAVTRHNYIGVMNPTLAGGATITDACVLRFDAAAGTHKAVDAGTTKTTPGTVNAWIKCNINDTVFYLPAYTSKTT